MKEKNVLIFLKEMLMNVSNMFKILDAIPKQYQIKINY